MLGFAWLCYPMVANLDGISLRFSLIFHPLSTIILLLLGSTLSIWKKLDAIEILFKLNVSQVVGVVVFGRMLMGTPHKVAGYLWLRFEESSRKKARLRVVSSSKVVQR